MLEDNSPSIEKPLNENRLIALVTLIQFTFVIEFMIVAPLGPDFVNALDAASADVGLVVASYTLAAALSGLVLAKFLDGFDRKKVVVFFLTGLALSTFACAFSSNVNELITFRFIAGLFGGPAATMAVAMIIDVVPEEKRGMAMGKVMSAFSIASIIGIPAGLQLSHWGGWQMPFYVISLMVALTILLISVLLPSMRIHLQPEKELDAEKTDLIKTKQHSFKSLFYRPEALITYLMTITSMLAAFFIIPNIAAFMQFNLGYPRESYGLLYLIGGIISLFVMRLTGLWIDKYDITRVSIVATVFIIFIIYAGIVSSPELLPAAALFVIYMAAMSMRNVASISISSMVPQKHERAAFTSLNQSVSHISAGLGALFGAYYLTSAPTGELIGMDKLGIGAIILCLFMPFCVKYLSSHCRNSSQVSVKK